MQVIWCHDNIPQHKNLFYDPGQHEKNKPMKLHSYELYEFISILFVPLIKKFRKLRKPMGPIKCM